MKPNIHLVPFKLFFTLYGVAKSNEQFIEQEVSLKGSSDDQGTVKGPKSVFSSFHLWWTFSSNGSCHFAVVMENSTSLRNPVLIAFGTGINALMVLAALFGNSLVCLAIYRNTSLRTDTNVFVLSLAIADLLTALLVMPFNTISIATGTWITGQVGCKMNYNIGNILGGTSVITITLLALNRYVRVVRSAELYRKIFSGKRAKVLAISAWIWQSLVVVISYLIWDKSQTFLDGPASCFQFFISDGPSKLHISKLIGYMTVTGAVTGACYLQIHKEILHHNAAVAPSTRESVEGGVGGTAHGVDEAKITKMLFVVVAGFYVCWLPVLVYSILELIVTINDSYYRYYTFYILFPVFTSSVINPIVYSVMNQALRKEFKKILLFQPTT